MASLNQEAVAADTADQQIDPLEVILCARYGELDDLRALAEAGVNVNVTDEHGNTALHMAAANGHVDVIEFLVPKMLQGAVSAANTGGNTPLHWAALNGHTAAVQKLVDFGASPQAKNAAGRAPLDEAVQGGHDAAAEAIVKSPRYDPELDNGPEPAPAGRNGEDEQDEMDGSEQ